MWSNTPNQTSVLHCYIYAELLLYFILPRPICIVLYTFMNFVHSCVWQLLLKNKRWDEMSLDRFKRKLKFYLFNSCFNVWIVYVYVYSYNPLSARIFAVDRALNFYFMILTNMIKYWKEVTHGLSTGLKIGDLKVLSPTYSVLRSL